MFRLCRRGALISIPWSNRGRRQAACPSLQRAFATMVWRKRAIEPDGWRDACRAHGKRTASSRQGYYSGLLDDGTDPDYWPALEYDPAALDPSNCASCPPAPSDNSTDSHPGTVAQDVPAGLSRTGSGRRQSKKKKGKASRKPMPDPDLLLLEEAIAEKLATAAAAGPCIKALASGTKENRRKHSSARKLLYPSRCLEFLFRPPAPS
ncbi:hypothetical protein WJX84_010574 [Apatococcus fuscideae]|uniref:Uncharacterized protein n=1 Tax=Apatococcus fuscideae TaxID=2026836 RepID=A0AAW1SP63_9CHLO